MLTNCIESELQLEKMVEYQSQLVLAKAMIPIPVKAKPRAKNRRSLLEQAANQPGQTKLKDFFNKSSVKNEPDGIGLTNVAKSEPSKKRKITSCNNENPSVEDTQVGSIIELQLLDDINPKLGILI